jgi:hypothetical protein
LLEKIKSHEDVICENYTKEVTEQQISEKKIKFDPKKGINSFEMHEGKMHNLIHYLQQKDLIWPTRSVYGGHGMWYALHPQLGETIMSIIAINIAVENGLDIVTSSGNIHHALASLDENEVFDTLIQQPKFPKPLDEAHKTSEMTDELALMVMNTHFNLDQLSAEQIAELIKEGKDLRRFKDAIVPIAQRIPDIRDPEKRKNRIKEASEEVIEEWRKYKKSLPRFALDALMDVIKNKVSLN